MFYQFMKWYLGWMIKLYFRRVYSAGLEKIPDGKPAIFASNHPAGFTEPIILATNVRQPVHFLVLGSFLRSWYLKWFFKGVKMVPIYRRDITGNQTIEKNKRTFEYVNNALKQNAHILIYPEAKTQFIYKVRPLRKGIVRMAYSFLSEKTHNALYIVPLGVNYLSPAGFRSDVFLEIGEPILLDETEGQEREWYIDKLDRIASGMKKPVFNVEDEDRHSTVQQLVQLYHNGHNHKPDILSRSYKRATNYVNKIRLFVDKLDQLDKDVFEDIKGRTELYLEKLNAKKLDDFIVKASYPLNAVFWLLLLTGWPLFILGAMLNSFSLIAGYLIRKNLVQRVEYKAAVSAAVPAGFNLILFVVLIVLGFMLQPILLVFAFLTPLSIYFFVYYYDLLKIVFQKLKWKLLSSKERSELLALRKDIFTNL